MTGLNTKLKIAVDEKKEKIIPENIKVGVSVYGIDGTYTSDANATTADIAAGKIAYVNGEKVKGTAELVADPTTYAELFTIADTIYKTGIEDDSETAEFTEDDEFMCLNRAVRILKGVI